MAGINKSKIFKKNISCECKCKLTGRKLNSNQKWNNDNCRCERKNPIEYNACEKVEYLANVEKYWIFNKYTHNSVIKCGEIINGVDSLSKNDYEYCVNKFS